MRMIPQQVYDMARMRVVDCLQCGRMLRLAGERLAAIKVTTWVDGDSYVSAEIDGWVVVWDQERAELLAACPCSRHLMPHHRDTGDTIVVPPTSEKC